MDAKDAKAYEEEKASRALQIAMKKGLVSVDDPVSAKVVCTVISYLLNPVEGKGEPTPEFLVEVLIWTDTITPTNSHMDRVVRIEKMSRLMPLVQEVVDIVNSEEAELAL